jgi:hypothetical protein
MIDVFGQILTALVACSSSKLLASSSHFSWNQSTAKSNRSFRSPAISVITRAPSQRTQVVGDVAEFPDHFGIIENAGGWITGATECDGADMTLLAR